MNAQWTFMASESNDKPPKSSEEVSRATPLDTIAEEKRFMNGPSNEDGVAVVEILTIEIAEIPIEDDPNEENDQNQEKDEGEKKEEDEKDE